MRCIFLLGLLLLGAYAEDFVVIGGGSTGSVIGGRLSENPKEQVLILERGEDRCHIFEDIVGYWISDFNERPEISADLREKSIYDTHYYSREINQVSRYLPMPFQAGGAALRNGNAFSRLTESELAGFNSSLWTFDATTNDWKDLFYHVPCTTSAGCNPDAHGTRGILHTNTFPPDANVALARDAMMEYFNLSWNNDSNGRSNIGVSLMHRNIKVVNGKPYRQEPYCNYLKPLLSQRRNLKMVTSALVTKVTLKKNGKHVVEYIKDGNVYQVKAKKEVIFAAGAIETPKLLKLSGIGSCQELNRFDIDCVVENEHVGEHLQDLSMDGLVYVNPPAPVASHGSIAVAYTEDGIEVAVSPLRIPVAPGVVLDGMLFLSLDLKLGAIGSVRLKSANPMEAPNISLNVYTSAPDNIHRLAGAVRSVRRFVDQINQKKGYTHFTAAAPSLELLPINATEAEAEAYLRGPSGASVEWHYVGSTSMHKVVNERLQLIDGQGKVIPGIRIAGNGVTPPNVMKSHSTSSTSMWYGQVASRLIREDHNLF